MYIAIHVRIYRCCFWLRVTVCSILVCSYIYMYVYSYITSGVHKALLYGLPVTSITIFTMYVHVPCSPLILRFHSPFFSLHTLIFLISLLHPLYLHTSPLTPSTLSVSSPLTFHLSPSPITFPFRPNILYPPSNHSHITLLTFPQSL